MDIAWFLAVEKEYRAIIWASVIAVAVALVIVAYYYGVVVPRNMEDECDY